MAGSRLNFFGLSGQCLLATGSSDDSTLVDDDEVEVSPDGFMASGI